MYSASHMSAALGKTKADLVIKGGTVVNVFTGELVEADVAVCGDKIVGVGSYEGISEVDAAGKYVCPGFIDAHLHLESVLVDPAALVNSAVAAGTTTFIADPHEAANVSGPAGIDFMLERTDSLSANVYFMLPSCVPATAGEHNGFVFDAGSMAPYLANPRVLGLGEVMDCRAVLDGDAGLHRKLDLFAGRVKDGHAGFLSEREFSAYTFAGISTDHECVDYETARAEVRAGAYVHIREGSAAKNLAAIISGIVKDGLDTRRFCFCTDDRHIDDIVETGHISANIRKSVALGLDPVKAVQIATINAAQCYNLPHLGALAPGRQADILILPDLSSFSPEAVYHKGRRIGASNGRDLPKIAENSALRHTVNIKKPTPADLSLRAGERNAVIALQDGQITTALLFEPLPRDKNNIFTPDSVYSKAVVIERHKKTGLVGLGAVKNFGICGGAIATTFSHDSHNIVAVGDNDRDILLAVSELERMQGGYALVENGAVCKTLPLPIMGLVGELDYMQVKKALAEISAKALDMGVNPGIDVFTTLSFLPLPVLPEARITPAGTLDVKNGKYI